MLLNSINNHEKLYNSQLINYFRDNLFLLIFFTFTREVLTRLNQPSETTFEVDGQNNITTSKSDFKSIKKKKTRHHTIQNYFELFIHFAFNVKLT